MTVVRKVRKHLKKAYNSKVGKHIRKVTRERYGTWGKINTNQIIKDVATLKRMINVEKKYVDSSIGEFTVGQCDVNGGGYACLDVTPVPNEGVTRQTRNGASIKISGSVYRMQIRQMSGLHTSQTIKIYIVRVKNSTYTTTTFPTAFLNADQITGLIDYNATRNPDNYNDFTVLKTYKARIPADNYSTMTSRFRDIQINLKQNNHVRFDGDTNNVLNGQIMMLLVADTGNKSTVAVSTLPKIANNQLNSGCYADLWYRHYYIDN